MILDKLSDLESIIQTPKIFGIHDGSFRQFTKYTDKMF